MRCECGGVPAEANFSARLAPRARWSPGGASLFRGKENLRATDLLTSLRMETLRLANEPFSGAGTSASGEPLLEA